MQPDKTFVHQGVTVNIYQDTDAESPNGWGDENLFLVSGHRDFYVMPPPDRQREDWETIYERYRGTHWVFRIEAYIHSGVRLAFSRTGNFPDRQWDVSQVGAIFAAKSEWRLSKSALKAATYHLEAWNQYLGGEVYGYVVDEDGPNEDSCWGFYGLEYCEQQAKEVAESVAKKRIKEQAEAERCACSDLVTV
jgi:hypothetical protein